MCVCEQVECVCVWTSYVWVKLCVCEQFVCHGLRSGRDGRTGVHNQKHEPHTKMWGIPSGNLPSLWEITILKGKFTINCNFPWLFWHNQRVTVFQLEMTMHFSNKMPICLCLDDLRSSLRIWHHWMSERTQPNNCNICNIMPYAPDYSCTKSYLDSRPLKCGVPCYILVSLGWFLPGSTVPLQRLAVPWALWTLWGGRAHWPRVILAHVHCGEVSGVGSVFIRCRIM